MPEQTYGGDDESRAKEAKKPDLKKYASMPDVNVRDVFWQIMDSYAKGRGVAAGDLAALEQHAASLLGIALTELRSERKSYHGLSRNAIAAYTIRMLLDSGWGGAFQEFISRSYGMRNAPHRSVSAALNRLYAGSEYRERISSGLAAMVREFSTATAALAYLRDAGNRELIEKLRKELFIIARNDIEENQHNAILALSVLAKSGDAEAKAVITSLLGHWDAETRMLVAGMLRKERDDATVEAAKRRLTAETDPEIRKVLSKIAEGAAAMLPKKVSKSVSALKKLKRSWRRVRRE